jgi:DNA helicase HerA-like ATPase
VPVALTAKIAKIASTDLFRRSPKGEFETGLFVGRPFAIDYDRAYLLISDAWKQKAKGIPQGTFLLAYYENEKDISEALLLRAIRPAKLPTDSEVISSMVEYYKDNLKTAGTASNLDSFTRYEFSFSGLECRILGTFFKDERGKTHFGADVENFYSAHNYSVIKPNAEVLATIANFREGDVVGKPTDIRLGRVRYSSTRRFQADGDNVPVYVSPADFLGKRTAMFGMTRTGKSNTVKKIIQSAVQMSEQATGVLSQAVAGATTGTEPFTDGGLPTYPVGQIIFDMNGEYANANMQDEGTAIFDLYANRTIRYSTIRKPNFRELKVNFYREVETGFELLRSYPSIATDDSRFVTNFRSVNLELPAPDDRSAYNRAQRRRTVYLCSLLEAGFPAPTSFTVSWAANQEVRDAVNVPVPVNRHGVITTDLATAVNWWTRLWEIYDEDPTHCFANAKQSSSDGREWADDDLKAMLVMLTRRSKSGGELNNSGFRVYNPVRDQHTETIQGAFETDILAELRAGRIVIIDLSLGDPLVQQLFSERICRAVFNDSMRRFTQALPNNFIQFYFEEAHNLFPRKEDKNLSGIYNRLAKEGAKLNIGLIYATQEVSSIGGNILKNTQNWFIAHLNNDDEIREIKKYYDFGDFTDALVRFSASDDKGFVRMKTYSNPFVVPVQIDRFSAKGGN